MLCDFGFQHDSYEIMCTAKLRRSTFPRSGTPAASGRSYLRTRRTRALRFTAMRGLDRAEANPGGEATRFRG